MPVESKNISAAHKEVDADLGVCAFDGIVEHRSIARLQLSHVIVNGPQVLRRTAAVIARGARPRFVLIRVRAGEASLRHRDGEVPLRGDECVLLDDREPFDIFFPKGSDSLWCHLPIDWVEGCLPDPQVAIAVPLGGTRPWAGMLREVVDTVHADDGTSPPFLVARSLCTALALAAEAIEVRSTAHSRKTFKSLQRTLAELACTCNVTIAQVAQAHGISLRYLHAIYSANGTSCGRELIRLRLERAHRLLRDQTEPNRSIDEIAWQCGFSDAGHFRRRFRALFGVSPSAMRADPARS